ncbi:MAG: hypothetical protein ACK6CU_22930, partial [Deltaproteobacteria bacterium]
MHRSPTRGSVALVVTLLVLSACESSARVRRASPTMGDASFGAGEDAGVPGTPPGCGDREICGNGIDDDCSGGAD